MIFRGLFTLVYVSSGRNLSGVLRPAGYLDRVERAFVETGALERGLL